MSFKNIRRLSLASLPLAVGLLLCSPSFAQDGCQEAVGKAVEIAVPVPLKGPTSGVPHWADLVLAQSASLSPEPLDRFFSIGESLISALEQGKADQVNEKFDGSPAMVLGFTREGLPFVAYKADLKEGGALQRLITSEQDADKYFGDRPELADIYKKSFQYFGRALQGVPRRSFENFLFQIDLLFSEGDNRIKKLDDEVSITANAITYRIHSKQKHFIELSRAHVGGVVHSVRLREIAGERIHMGEAPPDEEAIALVERFTQYLKNDGLFVIHPYRRGVRLKAKWNQDLKADIDNLKQTIREQLGKLTESFIVRWAGEKHLEQFKIFCNSFLRPPHNGGFYRHAQRRDVLDTYAFLEAHAKWIAARADKKTVSRKHLERFQSLYRNHRVELTAVVNAYYAANRLNGIFINQMPELFRSKLSGGMSEGVILDHGRAKLVDRLGFTILNNAKHHRGDTQPKEVETPSFAMEAPFDRFEAGTAILLMGLRPPHVGHIKMIQEVKKHEGVRRVVVVPSALVPNLEGTGWREIKATDSAGAFKRGDFQNVFSPALKTKILRSGLGSSVDIYPGDTRRFFSYLGAAKAQGFRGPITVVYGAKERDQPTNKYADLLTRYPDEVRHLVIDEQEGGISGTQTRSYLKAYCLAKTKAEKREAERLLRSAMSFVKRNEWASIRDEMARQWMEVEAVRIRVLAE